MDIKKIQAPHNPYDFSEKHTSECMPGKQYNLNQNKKFKKNNNKEKHRKQEI